MLIISFLNHWNSHPVFAIMPLIFKASPTHCRLHKYITQDSSMVSSFSHERVCTSCRWQPHITVQMQHSHQPPSPVGQAMQPLLCPLTMLEAAEVVVDVVVADAVEPGIVILEMNAVRLLSR